MNNLWRYIEENHGIKIIQDKPLSGGDISKVYHLKATGDDLVLKVNSIDKKEMFLSEQYGLKIINDSKIVRVPEVLHVGEYDSWSYILLEYIPSGEHKVNSFKDFGFQLAQMHQVFAENFGLNQDNFIGDLPQSNQKHSSWSQFYWEERIEPQYRIALEQNTIQREHLPHKNKFIEVVEESFGTSRPALLHGDLWNGNYMIDIHGHAVLIDPAVYYGHPMMDMGMTQLFGGFPHEFYDAYRDNISLNCDWDTAIELAQWYYLLVHLNLFGQNYLSSVNRIKSKYLNG